MTVATPTTSTVEIPPTCEKLGITPSPLNAVHGILDISWNMPEKMAVCLIGETGIGKTPIVKQWGKKRGFSTLVFSFSHMTQDKLGMAMFNEDGTEFDFVPPTALRELNDAADRDGGAILFIDEWNRGEKALMNGLFTLTDERRLHQFFLHKNVLVVAAMNPSDGTYLVNEAERDHAIRKRLNFVYVEPDLATWLRFAKDAEYHPLVTGYVEASPSSFYDYGLRDAGKCFPCPSNWEKISNVLKGAEAANLDLTSIYVRRLVEGQIGAAVGTAFCEYVRDTNVLIHPAEVLEQYSLATCDARRRVCKLSNREMGPNGPVLDTDGLSKPSSKHGVLRVDALTTLNAALAEYILEHPILPQPDGSYTREQYEQFELFGRNLGLYCMDLPEELAIALPTVELRKRLDKHGHMVQLYLSPLSKAMATQVPAYLTWSSKALVRQRKDAAASEQGAAVAQEAF